MAARNEIESYLNTMLNAQAFKDYGPNGLQVEGRADLRRIVSGVTASRDLIDAAIVDKADAIIVHHGLFWRGQDGRLVGWLGERVRRLMAHGINLFAYHLPLDAHPEFGNNAQLGLRLGLLADARFGEQDIGFAGPAGDNTSLDGLAARVQAALGGRAPMVLAGDGRALTRIGWCSGGAQGYFESAVAAGVDAFLTGEVSEPQAHLAKETGVAFLACGHHATECFGAPALAAHAAARFGIAHRFIEIDNPA